MKNLEIESGIYRHRKESHRTNIVLNEIVMDECP